MNKHCENCKFVGDKQYKCECDDRADDIIRHREKISDNEECLYYIEKER